MLLQLNRGEARHSLARATFFGQKGEVRQRYREGQEEQLGALGFVVNLIVVWNTLYLDRIVETLRGRGVEVNPEDVERLSPLIHDHISYLGQYSFALDEAIRAGAFHPLRELEGDVPDEEQLLLFPFRRRDVVPRLVLFSLADSKPPIFVLQEILFPSAVPLLIPLAKS